MERHVQGDSARRPPTRWWRRHPWWAGAALLGATTLGVLVAKGVFDLPALPAELPREVRQAVAGRAEWVGKAYVYDRGSNFIDAEQLWRVEVRPELIPALVQECSVVELASAEEVPGAFWRQRPYWWRPPRTGPARYFASP